MNLFGFGRDTFMKFEDINIAWLTASHFSFLSKMIHNQILP